MRRYFRRALPASAMLTALAMALLPGGYLGQVAAQGSAFLETFDGAPSAPAAYTNPDNWDILVQGFGDTEPFLAQHGPHCEAPGFPYTPTNSHQISTESDAVFQCNGHLMTTLGLTGYGAVYMTPPALMDMSGGTAVLKWDMSTLRTAARDWVDIVINPYAERQELAYNNNDQHVPPDNIHVELGGTNEFNVTQRVGGGHDVKIDGDSYTTWDMVMEAQNPPLTESAARRDSFEIDLSTTHIKVCLTGNNTGQTYTYKGQQGFCWVDADLPTPLSQSVWGTTAQVQLNHRNYNAEKSCTDVEDQFNIVHSPSADAKCPPDTWHWDNVKIEPAIPYSVIQPTQANLVVSDPSPQTVTFSKAAPANTNLEYVTMGKNSQAQVSFDNGATWQKANFQPATADGHDENGEMVWMPVPVGVQSVMVRGANGFWGKYWSYGFNLISKNDATLPQPAAPAPAPEAPQAPDVLQPPAANGDTPTDSQPSDAPQVQPDDGGMGD